MAKMGFVLCVSGANFKSECYFRGHPFKAHGKSHQINFNLNDSARNCKEIGPAQRKIVRMENDSGIRKLLSDDGI